MYQNKYLVYAFTSILSSVSELLEKNWIVEPFSMSILALRGSDSCLKNENMAEAAYALQFDIAMVQNNFHPIKKSFQVIELLLTLLQYSHV